MGGSDRVNGPSNLSGTLPQLEWSSKSYTPAEFPGCFGKPQVVRILPGDSEGWEGSFLVPAKKVNLGPELENL